MPRLDRPASRGSEVLEAGDVTINFGKISQQLSA